MNLIKPLAQFPAHDVETLLDNAFGMDRRSRTAYRLRTGQRYLPSLSIGMGDDAGHLVGALQCWPVSLVRTGQPDCRMVLVGPVAVDPQLQRSGYGRTMMDSMLALADQQSETTVTVMIGDPEYYGRFFGYDATPAAQWTVDGPIEHRRLLVRKPETLRLPVEGHIVPGWIDRANAGRANAARRVI